MRNRIVVTCATLLFLSASSATTLFAQGNPDAEVVGAPSTAKPGALIDSSWERINTALNNTKNIDTRIAAVTALSVMGGDAKAEKIITPLLHDADIDVRLAAIVAAGEMIKGGSRNLSENLRNQLNDADPKVAFTTASTLWKLDDPSGEDILMAVAQGERSGDYSFWKGSKHNATRTMHSPATLAKIAATQGMLILVPPVGIGMGAYGYLKGAGGPSPQVTSIIQIAKEHTDPVRKALIEATKTKDQGARLAAAEALAKFRGDDVREALRVLMSDDTKENVRLIASAAYIRVSTGTATKTTPAMVTKK